MRSRVFLFFLCVSFWFLGACNTPGEPKANPATAINRYFDVTGFVQKQVTLLKKEQPAALKQVIENGKPVEAKILATLNWQKELESFAELDINKPALRLAYSIQKADSAGFITLTYRRKPEGEGDILFLSVTTDQQQHVRQIRAIRANNNVLINTRQEMQLQADTKTGKTRVRSYQIRGLQKPVFFDSLQYVIVTQIK